MKLPEILVYFTVGTVSIVSVLGFIAKSLFNNYLNKKIEDYKNELARESDLFKSQLQKDAYEHQIKFSKLHNERAEVIKTLYRQLTELRTLLGQALAKEKKQKFDPEDVTKIWQLSGEARTQFESNKLYFADSLCAKIETFLTEVQVTNLLFDIHEKKGGEFKISRKGDISETELDKQGFLNVLDETGTLIELEKEFRKLIGVN